MGLMFYNQDILKTSTWVSKTPFLLFEYPGAAAAYSLRGLNGPNPRVVRVRRSSDNAESDFVVSDIDGGALVAFVGAGNDGFVTTWYDQSGNSNDATQATAASQPKIVSAGALVTENGKAALDFDGGDKILQNTNVPDLNNNAFWSAVVKPKKAENGAFVRYGSTNNRYLLISSSLPNDQIFYMNPGDAFINAEQLDALNLHAYTIVNNFATVYLNGQSVGSNSYGSSSAALLNIGLQTFGSFVFNGTLSELVAYSYDQSANRVGIETNINNHYGIF